MKKKYCIFFAMCLLLSMCAILVWSLSSGPGYRRFHPQYWGFWQSDPNVRARAIGIIWANNDTVHFLPELMPSLKDPNPQVRQNTILAFNNAGSDAVPYLQVALYDEDSQMRLSGLDACGMPDPRYERRFSRRDDQILIGSVIACTKDADSRVRSSAVNSLAWVALGAGQEEIAVTVLIGCLTDDSKSVRFAAAQALGRIARHTDKPSLISSALPALKQCLNDHAQDVRDETEWALEVIKQRKIGVE